MAFVSDPNQQQQGQQPGGTQGNPLAMQAPVSTSSAPGAGPGGAPGGNATGATASNQAPAQPFTNLQAYLTANAPQIQQQGQTIANNLGSQYGQIQNDIQSGVQGFQGQVQSGYAAPNADLVSQATTNPSQFSQNPSNVQSFQNQLNDSYTGPQNFEGSNYYANLNNEIQQATTNANQVNTPQGLQNYLMGTENNPTAGDTTLDQVLLSGSPQAYQQVQQAASPYANLPTQLSGIVPQQDQAVQDAITAAQQASQNAQTQIGNTSSNFANTLNTNYQNAAKGSVDYNNQINDIAQKMADGNYAALTPQEQTLIGYNPAVTSAFQQYATNPVSLTNAQNEPINFGNYFTQGPQATTPQPSDVVTPDQIAEYQALQTLSGNAPQTNFAMPTTSTSNTYGLPSTGPSFNNEQPLEQILMNLNPVYQPLLNAGFPGMNANQIKAMQDYMNSVYSLAGQTQPSPQPVNPPPALPPLQPPVIPPTGGGGGGFHAY